MSNIYGYCRISTIKQNILRQKYNILEKYPNAILYMETYTGNIYSKRKKFKQLLSVICSGDTIVFDSVTRFARNSDEGFKLYKKLYNKGINLIFLKEPYINTDTYKLTYNNIIYGKVNTLNIVVNNFINDLIKLLNKFLICIAETQIKQAFDIAEQEVIDIRQCTKDGIKVAKLEGKQIGHIIGTKLETKKSIDAKKKILKYSKDFNGVYNDKDVVKKLNISRNTYYKYKKELKIKTLK